MQPFGVLDRYIGKTIFTTIMMTLFMLVSLSGIIKFVDQLKKAGQGSYDALGAGMYTLLSVPKDVQIFFPMAALLGALLGLGMLAQRSELVVMQASGFTRMQVALSVMKTAIPLVLLTMAIGEWVAPQGEQMARNYRAQAMYGGSLLSTQQGLWAKDGNNFVYIERVKGDEELGGISIYAFNENRRLQSVRYAATAKFDPEHKVWRLSQVDESDLTQSETDHRFADGERHLENQPHARQTGRGGAGPGCTLYQRFAQLCEVSEVERSGCRTLSAQHVEQNLPAAIRGGDDADGAVVHLWPTA
ncbi:putative permease [Escherichia coli]|uniref:Putative permease n=1 Tax=Escherichia coli TaxID=562 RepID=A0A377KDZ9_ECOLX|nr:putative permease [Escherichia coli]